MERECFYCGVHFEPQFEEQHYCSAECFIADNEDFPPPYLPYARTCMHCGKTFLPIRKKQLYCSVKCRNEAGEKRRDVRRKIRKNVVIKKCAICGKEFEYNGKHIKYCSEECAYEALKARNRKQYYKNKGQIYDDTPPETYDGTPPEFVRKCAICGKEFEVHSNHKKYCSEKCAYEAIKARNRKQYYKNKIQREIYDEMSMELQKKKVPLEQLIKESQELGISYGKYRALLNMGKTYEELKAKKKEARNV